MAEVDFPSPSIFLDNKPTIEPPCLEPKTSTKKKVGKKNAVAKRRHTKAGQAQKSLDTPKPKQTKSRDGCTTCKEKRLKCDETHPVCQQCKRRKVLCGGYKKTFTFRTVDKFTFPGTIDSPKAKKQSSPVNHDEPPPELTTAESSIDDSFADIEPLGNALISQDASPVQPSSTPFDLTYKLQGSVPQVCDNNPFYNTTTAPLDEGFDEVNPFDQDDSAPSCIPPDTGSPLTSFVSHDTSFSRPSQPQCAFTDYEETPATEDFPALQTESVGAEEEIDELDHQGSVGAWNFGGPSNSASSSFSEGSLQISNIHLSGEDSGLLHHMFHTETCGILSIKNGERENPWKTMLWPLMFEERALYFAMLSMTASHAASHIPSLRFKGLELMTKSMQFLRTDLGTMRSDAALATTLVLAFSESWHSHIYTGIMHLRGARNLIMQGLHDQELKYPKNEDLARICFLRSTWVYMDVIARLTALGGEDPGDLDSIVAPPCGPNTPVQEIDPLMGCATTLFPLIGAVANLVKKVRKTRKTSLQDVTRAASLRDQILKWSVPSHFLRPKDKTLEVDHSRHTAEAYKLATLLYLYQAVPMICTHAPAELAEWTLSHLAAVPISSSATIIHIFPLLAAGCEAVSCDDREFVKERWEAMMGRMCIGNLDRCWDVVKEVWERRDEWNGTATRRGSIASHCSTTSSHSPGFANLVPAADIVNHDGGGNLSDHDASEPNKLEARMPLVPRPTFLRSQESARRDRDEPTPTVIIEPEMTVRGRLHWVAVMEEKKWEILLG